MYAIIKKNQCEAIQFNPFRVETILDNAKDTIHVFTPDGAAWEDTEIKLDIQGIDFADVVYEAGDSRYINLKMLSNLKPPLETLDFLDTDFHF